MVPLKSNIKYSTLSSAGTPAALDVKAERLKDTRPWFRKCLENRIFLNLTDIEVGINTTVFLWA